MRQEEFKASLKYIVRSEFEVTMGYMRPFQIKKKSYSELTQGGQKIELWVLIKAEDNFSSCAKITKEPVSHQGMPDIVKNPSSRLALHVGAKRKRQTRHRST